MSSSKIVLTMVFLSLFPCILQAASYEPEPLIQVVRADFYKKNYPSYKNEPVKYIEPYDRSFSPINYCDTAFDFKITNLAMQLHYGFIDSDQLNYPIYYIVRYQYDYQFHVVKIDYEITCRGNKLTYGGTEYLASQSRILNNTTPGNGDIGKEMSKERYDFMENLDPNYYINADGTITRDARYNKIWPHYTIARVDTVSILKKWEGQKVSIPDHKYMGTPGKLPRPVLLIHGLDSDYEVWGVTSTVDKKKENRQDDTAFKAGRVESYKNGSLPDMLARSNNLYTEKNDSTGSNGIKYSINSNGIYFFQAPGEKVNGDWEDANPHWINYDKDGSQSRALYEKIDFVMNDFYYKKLGIEWWLSDKYQIDLVGHSQGGLVIREMLRGLRGKDAGNFPQGTQNPANHINRVITVNTPHFGSALATQKENLEGIKQEYPGLFILINDIEDSTEHTLVEAEVDAFWEIFAKTFTFFSEGGDVIIPGGFGSILGIGIGTIAGTIAAASTDVILTIKGPYIGTYKPELTLDLSGLWNKTKKLGDIKTMEGFKNRLAKPRNSGNYLDKNNKFIADLNDDNADGLFPLRPDGSKITLLPMYSDSSHKILPELLKAAGEESNRLCAMGDKDPNCFAAGTVLKKYAWETERRKISNVKFDSELWKALVSIQDDWLVYGDAVVEASSQKFISNTNKPDNEYFLEPRSYAIHDALAPWEPVLHGPFEGYEGAPQQGLDLLCALSPRCDNAFTTAQYEGRNAILKLSEIVSKGGFNERSLEVTGNYFDLAPSYISEGIQAFSIVVNGKTVLIAKYEPGKGSSIAMDYNGTEQNILLLGPEFATQPSIARKGDSLFVTFTNYSGQSFKESYFLPELPQNVTATVITPTGSAMSPVIIGSAVASNPETQKPPTPPPGHVLAPVTLAAIHREARGEHESNTSRPRFLVFNATEDTLEFSKVAYYFTADPTRKPKVVVDYPQVPITVENLGGDEWRFVIDVGNKKIAPKAFYPSADGWQIRVHYSDWYEYDHLDDWSADYSIGMVQPNRKIVIYDKNGKIIWGNEAPGFESEDNGIIPMPKGTIAWKDDSPWETNAFKPRVSVKNTGSVALSDYHAQLWFRVPQGKTLSPLEVWYAPESSPSVKNVGGSVWMLDINFNKHILYSGDSISEGNIGLHLTDWSMFDKTVCGIVLKDKDGNVLFGKEPSVAECESYNGPNLLLPQYSRKQ